MRIYEDYVLFNVNEVINISYIQKSDDLSIEFVKIEARERDKHFYMYKFINKQKFLIKLLKYKDFSDSKQT